jgi:hypothetical protein
MEYHREWSESFFIRSLWFLDKLKDQQIDSLQTYFMNHRSILENHFEDACRRKSLAPYKD